MENISKVIDSDGNKWEYIIIESDNGYTIKEYKNDRFSYKWEEQTKENALMLVEHWLYKYSS